MARITVEDCLPAVPNRFELVLLAGCRARALHRGAVTSGQRPRDKATVTALRELASGAVDPRDLREALVTSLQRYLPDVDPDPDDLTDDLMPDDLASPRTSDPETARDAA